MPIDYHCTARYWIEPLLALNVGGAVALRFLAPLAGSQGELGIVPAGANTYIDYPAARSYVRELKAEEIATLGGIVRLGAREVLLSDAFAASVAAAQGVTTPNEMLETAAGALISGQICRIQSVQPLDIGEGAYAWQLLCDAPLDAA